PPSARAVRPWPRRTGRATWRRRRARWRPGSWRRRPIPRSRRRAWPPGRSAPGSARAWGPCAGVHECPRPPRCRAAGRYRCPRPSSPLTVTGTGLTAILELRIPYAIERTSYAEGRWLPPAPVRSLAEMIDELAIEAIGLEKSYGATRVLAGVGLR